MNRILCLFFSLIGFGLTAQDCKIETLFLTNQEDLLIFYEDAPKTGMLTVNGQNFPIGNSPQKVSIDLEANRNVLVNFSEQPLCMLAVSDVNYPLHEVLRPEDNEESKLEMFTAVAENNKHELSWEATKLQTGMYFKVLKSTDGFFYKELERITIQDIQEELFYYSDNNVNAGLNIYKIELWNGYEKVLNSESISLKKIFVPEVKIWPVPLQDELNIFFDASAHQAQGTIQIYKLDGRLIQQEAIQVNPGYNELTIDTESLSTGNYVLKISYADKQEIKKITKTK